MKKKILLVLAISTMTAHVKANDTSDSDDMELTLNDRGIAANLSDECTDFADAVDNMIVDLPQESAAFKASIESFTMQWHNFDKAQLQQINTNCKTMAEHIRKRIAANP